MTEMRAFDMGRFQRIVFVEGNRVSGLFKVLSTKKSSDSFWVSSCEMTIYSEDKSYGRVFHSGDLSAEVVAGEVELAEHMVASNKLADAKDAWDELLEAILAASEAARFDEED